MELKKYLEFAKPVTTSRVRINIITCDVKCGMRSAIIYDGTDIVLNIPKTPTPYKFDFKCSTCNTWDARLKDPTEFEFVEETGLMTLKP
jgi:hypothetical protein